MIFLFASCSDNQLACHTGAITIYEQSINQVAVDLVSAVSKTELQSTYNAIEPRDNRLHVREFMWNISERFDLCYIHEEGLPASKGAAGSNKIKGRWYRYPLSPSFFLSCWWVSLSSSQVLLMATLGLVHPLSKSVSDVHVPDGLVIKNPV